MYRKRDNTLHREIIYRENADKAFQVSQCIAIKKIFERRASDALRHINGDETQSDRFLLDPPKKPKAEIADLVESFGIKVPKRYAGLKEALESGDDFIVRSEHPYEYAGIGGLLNSYEFRDLKNYQNKNFRKYIEMLMKNEDLHLTKEEEHGICADGYWVFHKLMKQFRRGIIDDKVFEEKMKLTSMKSAKRFAALSDIPVEDFLKKMSFSYWQLIPGYNRMIIADDGIRGRYHIITNGGTNWYYRNYTIYENGIILPNEVSALVPELQKSLSQDISFYEQIRNLPCFDNANCPIIELQTDFNGNNHFLQTHYGQKTQEADFTLDRPLEDGETEAEFVRGVTPSGGLIGKLSVTHHYAGIDEKVEELGSNDPNHDVIYSGFMNKRKPVGLVQGSFDKIRYGITCHTEINRLFGQEVAAVLDVEGLIGEEKRQILNHLSREKKKYICLNFRIISDGRRAYVKLLDDVDEVIERYSGLMK